MTPTTAKILLILPTVFDKDKQNLKNGGEEIEE
jgi:hypothetical protein